MLRLPCWSRVLLILIVINYLGRSLLYLLIAVEAIVILWLGRALLELLKEAGGVLEHAILLELMMIRWVKATWRITIFREWVGVILWIYTRPGQHLCAYWLLRSTASIPLLLILTVTIAWAVLRVHHRLPFVASTVWLRCVADWILVGVGLNEGLGGCSVMMAFARLWNTRLRMIALTAA